MTTLVLPILLIAAAGYAVWLYLHAGALARTDRSPRENGVSLAVGPREGATANPGTLPRDTGPRPRGRRRGHPAVTGSGDHRQLNPSAPATLPYDRELDDDETLALAIAWRLYLGELPELAEIEEEEAA
jgi:hypothetical protein